MFRGNLKLGYNNPNNKFQTLRLKWVNNSCFTSLAIQLLYAVEEFRDFFASRQFKDESSKKI